MYKGIEETFVNYLPDLETPKDGSRRWKVSEWTCEILSDYKQPSSCLIFFFFAVLQRFNRKVQSFIHFSTPISLDSLR